MREAKERFLYRAREKAEADQAFAAELGITLIAGMLAVIEMEKYAGREGLRHTYENNFPDPDGEGHWTFTIERAGEAK